jgi:galactokinase
MPDAGDQAFAALFGRDPDVRADAPGRVNLIGEHTDYHQGFVLPAVIPQRTHVRLKTRGDGRVRVWSAGVSDGIEEYQAGRETPGRGWLDYVQGVTAILEAAGMAPPGFEARIESSVPVGAGVSSSAALDVALLRALRTAMRATFDDVELAKLAQRVETEFVGAPVGIMDQIAVSVGRDGEALFLDTRSLQMQRIPLPPAVALVVINSGLSHQHAGGEYVTRRRESFEAAAALGVEVLRDVPIESLAQVNALPPPLARRARHIVTENGRVQRAATALRDGDLDTLARLFAESHASMRDDYEISTPEIDALVSIAAADPAVSGARLTGGGFGGAIVALAQAHAAPVAARRIVEAYRAAHPASPAPSILVPAA